MTTRATGPSAANVAANQAADHAAQAIVIYPLQRAGAPELPQPHRDRPPVAAPLKPERRPDCRCPPPTSTHSPRSRPGRPPAHLPTRPPPDDDEEVGALRRRRHRPRVPVVARGVLVGSCVLGGGVALVAQAQARGRSRPNSRRWRRPQLPQRARLAPPAVRFTDITARGRHHASSTTTARTATSCCPRSMGGGAAFFDFDNDGDQDLLFVNSTCWPWPGAADGRQPSRRTRSTRNDGAGSLHGRHRRLRPRREHVRHGLRRRRLTTTTAGSTCSSPAWTATASSATSAAGSSPT